MVFTENARYDAIDNLELNIDMDINAGYTEDVNSLVKGKYFQTTNKQNLIKKIKEYPFTQEEIKECIKIIQYEL